MPAAVPDMQHVKSAPVALAEAAADRHKRAKDYLAPGEVARLLDTAKDGRHRVRDHFLLLMTYRHSLGDCNPRHTVHSMRTACRRCDGLWEH